MKVLLCGAALACLWACAGAVAAAEPAHAAPTAKSALFSVLFPQSTMGSAFVVQVSDDTTLVFDDGTYQLSGRDLIVYARHAIVKGHALILSYDPASAGTPPSGTPATPGQTSGYSPGCVRNHNGCGGIPGLAGKLGGKGTPGIRGPRVVLSIGDLASPEGGKLEVTDIGQKGSKGQTGGQGGQGADGQSGDDQREFPDCSGPYAGGGGGPGGQRGAGGQGGDGGRGGVVLLSPSLTSLISASSPMFQVSVAGGPGGADGDAGNPGVGGGGGPRGSGAHTCVGGSGPNPAPTGPLGPDKHDPTPPSVTGPLGEIKKL